MSKTRLCSRDEWALQEALEEFRDKLHEIGVLGMADIVVYPEGNINANLGVDEACTLEMKIISDGDYISREYKYGDVTR